MDTNRRLIDYYFSNYKKDYSTCNKRLATFQGALFPLSICLAHGDISNASPQDTLSLIMDDAFRNTYKHFRGNKRNLMKSRYLIKHDRRITSKFLGISTRTYHRYLEDILDYAIEYLEKLMIEKAEYERQTAFLESKNQNTQQPT